MSQKIPVGKIPLKHRVLAILSFAAQKGKQRVPLEDYFDIFEKVVQKHPEVFPGVMVKRTAFSAYSKQLDSAQQELIGSGTDLPNPTLQVLETGAEWASRNLDNLRGLYGADFVDSFEPLGTTFVDAMNAIEQHS